MGNDSTMVAWAVSAARNGLTAVTIAAGETVCQVNGNFVQPPAKADTLKGMTTISAAVANCAESYIQNTADPTLYRYYQATDQTTLHTNGIVRMNKTLRSSDGTLSQIIAYNNNANNAQIEAVIAQLGPSGGPFLTTQRPSLPSNTRTVTATSAATAVSCAWTDSGAVTLNSFNPIPGTKYAVYGMGFQGATAMAFRKTIAAGMLPTDLMPGAFGSDTKGLLEVWYNSDVSPIFTFDGNSFGTFQILCSAGDTAQYYQLIIGEV